MSTEITTMKKQHPFHIKAFRTNLEAIDGEVRHYLKWCFDNYIKTPKSKIMRVDTKKFFMPRGNSLATINAYLSAFRWYTPADLSEFDSEGYDYTRFGYACRFIVDPTEKMTLEDGRTVIDFSRAVRSFELIITTRPGTIVNNIETRPVGKRDVAPAPVIDRPEWKPQTGDGRTGGYSSFRRTDGGGRGQYAGGGRGGGRGAGGRGGSRGGDRGGDRGTDRGGHRSGYRGPPPTN